MRQTSAFICLCLLLSACAQPLAKLPHVSKAEQLAEAERQEKLSHGAVKIDYAKEITYSKSEKTAMQKHLQKVVDKLTPEATKLCFELAETTVNCEMHIELSSKDKGINAHADGEKIVINAHMVDFTKGEDEQLAFVLAHEYVHHMMGHVGSAKQNVMLGSVGGLLVDFAAAAAGVNTRGGFSKIGGQTGLLQYSPGFEQEADYIALYMLERAGFNIDKAPHFWRRMARYNPKGIYTRTTHPTTPERFVMMEKIIKEIKHKKKSGEDMRPNFLPKDA